MYVSGVVDIGTADPDRTGYRTQNLNAGLSSGPIVPRSFPKTAKIAHLARALQLRISSQ